MVAAAVLWSVVAAASFAAIAGKATGTTGDPSGLGDLFVGIAAMVAAVSAWWNSRKSNKALGPPNGSTVQQRQERIEDVLIELHALFEYQRVRNHDVLNHLTALRSSTPLVIDVCERLLAKLREEG